MATEKQQMEMPAHHLNVSLSKQKLEDILRTHFKKKDPISAKPLVGDEVMLQQTKGGRLLCVSKITERGGKSIVSVSPNFRDLLLGRLRQLDIACSVQ